ncbi:MAG: hypothetical protein GY774_31650 [Planctomycetes bacterium]|nr:hypothetical protein [Planctomycetota bacterium]
MTTTRGGGFRIMHLEGALIPVNLIETIADTRRLENIFALPTPPSYLIGFSYLAVKVLRLKHPFFE